MVADHYHARGHLAGVETPPPRWWWPSRTPPRGGRRWRRPWLTTARFSARFFALRYLPDEAYRRRITPPTQQGRDPAFPAGDLSFAHEGAVRGRHFDQQTGQALRLSLVVNAISWLAGRDGAPLVGLQIVSRCYPSGYR